MDKDVKKALKDFESMCPLIYSMFGSIVFQEDSVGKWTIVGLVEHNLLGLKDLVRFVKECKEDVEDMWGTDKSSMEQEETEDLEALEGWLSIYDK